MLNSRTLLTCVLLIAVLGIGIGTGCTADRVDEAYFRDGIAYGVTDGPFRGRWWSYYERGVSFMAGEFYEEAIQDFKVALNGYSRDSWRARTYGLHFTEYFPNREMGIALLQLGQLDDAMVYLLRSIHQVDTERAYYYLDHVKREKIARGELPADTTPQIRTDTEGRLLVAEREFDITIEAEDVVGVSGVEINGRRLYQRGSQESLHYRESVLLGAGAQSIEVAAVNLADNRSVDNINVIVDLTGPNIGIHSPVMAAVIQDSSMLLEGVVVDQHGIDEIQVDGRVVMAANGETRIPFSASVNLVSGENVFVVSATDRAGNETRSAIRVYQGAPDEPTAQLWQRSQKQEAGLKLADAGTGTLGMLLSATPEDDSAAINLKSPRSDRPYRHNRTLRVSGEVISSESIVTLVINDEPFAELTGAPRESFNKRFPIDVEIETEIDVSIRAEDAAGNVMSHDVRVPVRPVDLDTRESRMPVAVLAFSGHGIDTETSEYLRVSTESRIFQQNRFRVLDRIQLQDVLTEQQLASALANPDEAIAIGKLTPAHIFIVTDVFSHGTSGLELKTRVISTETSDLMATLDVFIEDREDNAAILQACENLATQLATSFPRISGEITGVRSRGTTQDLLVDLTQEDGVKEGTYLLIVYEEEPWIDEDTGEELAPGEFIEVGRARITGVTPSNVRAQTVEQEQGGTTIEAGLPAITM